MVRDYEALDRLLAEREAMPFAYGKTANDCVSFCGAAVVAQTGIDRLKDVSWTSELGAARLLKRLGGLRAAVSARLRPIPVAHAHRGDIAGVAADDVGTLALMVIEGQTLIGPGRARLSRTAMLCAWSAD